MIKNVIALLQGNKGHTSAYTVLVVIVAGAIGTSVDLLLELGELRAMETYYEMAIDGLTERLYECEND